MQGFSYIMLWFFFFFFFNYYYLNLNPSYSHSKMWAIHNNSKFIIVVVLMNGDVIARMVG